jgi:flagellar biosynthesis protein FlhB
MFFKALIPPSIAFSSDSIEIDWSVLNPIKIFANIYSYGSSVISQNSLVFNISNAKNYTISQTINPNNSFANITIIYFPAIEEYPIFQ